MDHPELLVGENPLFSGVAPFLPFSEIPQALNCEPLKDIPWRTLEPQSREPLLGLIQEHFFPTPESIEITSRIQASVRASLARRNPLGQEEQRRINQLALLEPNNLPQTVLPSLANPASGGIIAAETGLGKTSIIRRALKIIAPQTLIKHGHSPECGWASLTQISYLLVDLPTNGSRGALINRILHAVDSVAGTQYVEKNRRLRNIDESLLLVMKVLSIDRVGALVLDEGQPDNLAASPWEREFVLFFLSLMNLGIPIVLSGHPMAFTNFEAVAQVIRRFSATGHFTLSRAKAGESWWTKALVPGVMRFNLCDHINDPQKIVEISRALTAGIPGLFVARWREAQLISLRRGGERATVTPDDFDSAGRSPTYVQLAKMVGWLEEGEGSGYGDLAQPTPAAPAGTAAERASHNSHGTSADSERAAITRALHKIKNAEKRDATKASKQMQKDLALLKNASPEDLRRSMSSLELLAGLDNLQNELLDR